MEYYDVANYVWNFHVKETRVRFQLQQPQLIRGSQLDGVKSIRWNSEKKMWRCVLGEKILDHLEDCGVIVFHAAKRGATRG